MAFDSFRDQFPNQFMLVTYSDLLANTLEEVYRLFYFAGINATNQTREFYRKSRSADSKGSYGIHKSSKLDAKWRSELPEFIISTVEDDLEGTILERYLE